MFLLAVVDMFTLDLMKLKDVLSDLMDNPNNEDSSLKLQISDILTDVHNIVKYQELKNIVVFKTGSECIKWKIDYRMGPVMGQTPIMVITPDKWVTEIPKKETEKEEEEEIIYGE